MVNGLQVFRQYFSGYDNAYVLIGGIACEINLTHQAIPFRATRDFDMVLCVEALTSNFMNTFWAFIKEGGYSVCEKSTGKKQFYRFRHPVNDNYPIMLELFS